MGGCLHLGGCKKCDTGQRQAGPITSLVRMSAGRWITQVCHEEGHVGKASMDAHAIGEEDQFQHQVPVSEVGVDVGGEGVAEPAIWVFKLGQTVDDRLG